MQHSLNCLIKKINTEMKFEKVKNTKTPAVKTTGNANQKLMDKIKRNSVYGTVVTPATKPDPEYIAPTTNTTNMAGHVAYKDDSFLYLMKILNTLKLDGDQFYRTEAKAMADVKNAIAECAKNDVYLTAQCIRYSRVDGEGLRSVSHLASAYLAEYLSGKDFAKYVYSRYNKGTKIGGVVFRIDDMVQIANVYFAVSGQKMLPNSLKKGFAIALENADNYELLKYKNNLIDIINLVHPNSAASKATVEVDTAQYLKVLEGLKNSTKNESKKLTYSFKIANCIAKAKTQNIKTLDAIMLGLSVSADTHEVRNSEAGQIVSAAKKAGKITDEQAVTLLAEAKTENFKELLQNGKLGVLALVRNLVNLVKNNADAETIKLSCALLTNADAIRKSLVHPMQLDIAYEMLNLENGAVARQLMSALQTGFELALPNISLTGKTAIFVDFSGSMDTAIYEEKSKRPFKTSALNKAMLIAATLAKATNADIYFFANSTIVGKYDVNMGVFALKDYLARNYRNGGGTSISSPFNFITNANKHYDRIVLLSDNESNSGDAASKAAQTYFNKVTKAAMVYSVDLAAYGTSALKGENVYNLYGYGFTMFQDMMNREYNPQNDMNNVRKVRFKNKEV